jgi:hypothetical protein
MLAPGLPDRAKSAVVEGLVMQAAVGATVVDVARSQAGPRVLGPSRVIAWEQTAVRRPASGPQAPSSRPRDSRLSFGPAFLHVASVAVWCGLPGGAVT